MEQPEKATPLSEEEHNSIAAAIARIPSGCSILTAGNESRATGTLVSWVQQASFEPPSITVGLKRGRPIVELVDAAGCFLLNVIGDDPSTMFKHFGKGFSLDEEAFDGLTVRCTEFGPAIESCVAHLGCRVTAKVPIGDHDLYAAEVAAAGVVEGARPYTHLRRSGKTY